MSGEHIVVIDDREETRRQVDFLLRLAGYKVTPVRGIWEALNWTRILNWGKWTEPVRCLLFSNLPDSEEVEKVGHFLFRDDLAELPILIIDRAEARIGKIPDGFEINRRVAFCEEDTFLETLENVLKTDAP